MKKILFVCTGNTCRSSMAKEIFQHLKKEENPALNYFADSAGTSAYLSLPASMNAIKALEEINIDLNSHLSKQLTKELINESTLILTMTRSHKNYILNAMPEVQDKVFTLKEYIEEAGDIIDPYGGDINTYRKCRDEILKSLMKMINKLKMEG